MADTDPLPLADVLHDTAREMRYQGDWWAEVARAAREHIAAEILTADVPGRGTDWSLDEGIRIGARIAAGGSDG